MEYLASSLCLILIVGCVTAEPLETEIASQCFKSVGIPKVRFSCGNDKMIAILKAFHGIPEDRPVQPRSPYADEDTPRCTPNPGHASTNCSYCANDCIDDSMNLVYDWSTCMGNSSCERTVMQSYIPSCKEDDKFSHYLQTQYQCVPRADVIDICSNIDTRVSSGYLMSPGYPNNYPPNQDCLCRIEADWSTKIQLSFYDLLLQTRNGRCRADWLMLRQGGQKHRHCGAIMTGIKNITSEGQSIALQFHTDSDNNHTQNFQYFVRSLKGFWLKFQAADDSRSQLHVTCRVMTKHDREVKEILTDDLEFEDVLSEDEELVTTSVKPSNEVDPQKPNKDTNANGNRKPNKNPNQKPGVQGQKDNQKGEEDFGGSYSGGDPLKAITVTMATMITILSVLVASFLS